MKKLQTISILLMLFISSLAFIQCNDSDGNMGEEIIENNSILSIEELHKDKRLNNYIEKELKIISNIKSPLVVKELTLKNELNKDEIEKLSIAMGFNSSSEYINFYKSQKETLLSIQNDYNFNSQNQNIIEKEILKNYLLEKEFTSRSDVSDCLDSCDRTERNCVGTTMAATIAGHAGCVATDVTVIGGIVCHGAVALAQYFALDECVNQREICGRGCGK